MSNLTVTFNDKPVADKAAAAPKGGPTMDNPQMTEMMKTMFKGFKVNIDLQVAGTIVKTNADHVAGSKVTLLEMDLEALLADEAKLKEVQKVLGPERVGGRAEALPEGHQGPEDQRPGRHDLLQVDADGGAFRGRRRCADGGPPAGSRCGPARPAAPLAARSRHSGPAVDPVAAPAAR